MISWETNLPKATNYTRTKLNSKFRVIGVLRQAFRRHCYRRKMYTNIVYVHNVHIFSVKGEGKRQREPGDDSGQNGCSILPAVARSTREVSCPKCRLKWNFKNNCINSNSNIILKCDM